MKKKILSFLIAICLIIPCAVTLVACKDKDPKMETWDGSVAEVSAAVNNVITIETAEELAGVAKAVNEGNTFAGKTIKLAKDMDMANKAWTPIGVGNRKDLANAKVFSGTFDGNDKKITGLTNGDYAPATANKNLEGDFTSDVYTYSYGLFGMTQDATIKNLTITVNFDCNAEDLKGDSVGGLVGFATGSLTIQDCEVNGTIDGGYDGVGGLVGRAYNSTATKGVLIEDSENKASVKAIFKAAGILGYVNSATLNVKIDDCENEGTIEVTGIKQGNTFVSSVAGIVNYGWKNSGTNTIVVTNNENDGTIKSAVDTEEAGVINYHGYALIARSAGEGFNSATHTYDFRGNTNTAKAYYNGVEATDALKVTLNQSYPVYSSANDVNGQTNIAQ